MDFEIKFEAEDLCHSESNKIKEIVLRVVKNGTKILRGKNNIRHIVETKALVKMCKDTYDIAYYKGLKAQGCPDQCDIMAQADFYIRKELGETIESQAKEIRELTKALEIMKGCIYLGDKSRNIVKCHVANVTHEKCEECAIRRASEELAKEQKQLSKCCGATVYSSHDGTNRLQTVYYICDKCDNACDIKE